MHYRVARVQLEVAEVKIIVWESILRRFELRENEHKRWNRRSDKLQGATTSTDQVDENEFKKGLNPENILDFL